MFAVNEVNCVKWTQNTFIIILVYDLNSHLNSVNSIRNCWWAINHKSSLCFADVEYRNLSGDCNYYLFGTYVLYIIYTAVTADDSTIILFAVGLCAFTDIVVWNPLRVVTVRIILVISAIKNKSFRLSPYKQLYNSVCYFFAFLNDFILAIMFCYRCNNNYVHRPIINLIFNILFQVRTRTISK